MGSFDSRGDPAGRSTASNADAHVPAACPTCRSTSITTTAKTPDSESYWRCTKCGEVWNDSRRQAARQNRHGWR
jgi:transposase-like protein